MIPGFSTSDMSGELMDSSEASLLKASQDLAAAGEPKPTEASPEISGREKRVRLFELCLVLLIAFGGYFFSSFYVLVAGHGIKFPPPVQNAEWMESISRELAGLLLLRYVLWRRKLGFRILGLRWSFRDLGIGLAVAIVSYVAYGLGHSVVSVVYRALFSTLAGGATAKQLFSHPSLIAFPFTILNSFFEELIVRAYLMTEIGELTGSWTLAAAASVAVQTSYHLYYGWVGALSLSFGFLVFSIYYAKTRRATPIIFAHALIDLYAFVWFL
jgi:membrane protease YdiL (CAAX protease family)